MSTRLPLFVLIGAAHAGMGEVASWLALHPEVADKIPAQNFFQHQVFEQKGVAWYETQLKSHAKSGRLYGDCSAGYLIAPEVPKRIAESYPDAKLIVILRHPVRRALAEYIGRQKTDRQAQTQPAATYLQSHTELLEYGLYGKHLSNYFSYYSPLQLHVIVYEDLVASPLKVYENLCKFLDIDATFIPKPLRPYAPPPDEPKHPSIIWRLKHRIKMTYRAWFVKPTAPLFVSDDTLAPVLSKDMFSQLEKNFRPDTDLLSHLLKQDMAAHWRYDGTDSI